jgi:hypothetical protein
VQQKSRRLVFKAMSYQIVSDIFFLDEKGVCLVCKRKIENEKVNWIELANGEKKFKHIACKIPPSLALGSHLIKIRPRRRKSAIFPRYLTRLQSGALSKIVKCCSTCNGIFYCSCTKIKNFNDYLEMKLSSLVFANLLYYCEVDPATTPVHTICDLLNCAKSLSASKWDIFYEQLVFALRCQKCYLNSLSGECKEHKGIICLYEDKYYGAFYIGEDVSERENKVIVLWCEDIPGRFSLVRSEDCYEVPTNDQINGLGIECFDEKSIAEIIQRNTLGEGCYTNSKKFKFLI